MARIAGTIHSYSMNVCKTKTIFVMLGSWQRVTGLSCNSSTCTRREMRTHLYSSASQSSSKPPLPSFSCVQFDIGRYFRRQVLLFSFGAKSCPGPMAASLYLMISSNNVIMNMEINKDHHGMFPSSFDGRRSSIKRSFS